MALFKCKACRGTLEVDGRGGVVSCRSCGFFQTMPKLPDPDRANRYERAYQSLQNFEYDKAAVLFKQLRDQDPTDPELYWAAALCRYGVISSKDGSTGKLNFELNRAQAKLFSEDSDYLLAMERAGTEQRRIYEGWAAQINQSCQQIHTFAKNQTPVDVFLLSKEEDNTSAIELYDALTQSGLRVFFASRVLKDKPKKAHEAYIYAAMTSMQVMLVLGTKPEYFNLPEIRNTWIRVMYAVRSGESKSLVPLYKSMTPDKLPKEFANLRALDITKKEMIPVVVRGVNKIVDMQMAKTSPGVNIETAPLLRQANRMLSESKWSNATEIADKALTIDQSCAGAYIVKLLASLKLKTVPELANMSVSLEKSPNYNKAMEFGSPEQKQELQNCQDAIMQRLAEAEMQRQYDAAIPLIKARKYEQAIEILVKIKDFKDSAELLARCQEIKSNAPKEATYVKAMQAASARDAGPEIWIKCIAAFKSISGYKDADAQAQTLQARVDKWQQAKKEAEEKARIKAEQQKLAQINKAEKQLVARRKRKKFFKVSSIVLSIMLLVYAGIGFALIEHIIPNARYSDADEMFLSGNLEDAKEIYANLDDHKESEQRVAAIQAIQKIQDVPENDVDNTDELDSVITSLLKAQVPVEVTYQTAGGYLVDPAVAAIVGNVLALPGQSNPILLDASAPAQTQDSTTVAYTDEKQFDTLEIAARAGYEFVEWTCVSHSYDIKAQNPVFEMTIAATWSAPNQYTITYDLVLDQVEFAQENPDGYCVETPGFTLTNPERAGYTFMGWTGTGLDGAASEVTVQQGSIGNREYVASWQANSYTLSFDVSGGNTAFEPMTVTYDQAYVLPVPERTGYTFAGWFAQDREYTDGIWNDAADVELVAMWVANEYTVTFVGIDSNSQYAPNDSTTYTVKYDQEYVMPVPFRVGYSYQGCYLGEERIADGAWIWNYTEDITLEVKWEPLTHVITLDVNGGTASVEQINVTYDTYYTLPSAQRTGYTFMGWYTKEGKEYKSDVWKDVENLELIAAWSANQFTITINGVDSQGQYAPGKAYVRAATYDNEFTMPALYRTGYSYQGCYLGEERIDDGTWVWNYTENITLEVRWAPLTHVITLDPDGGNVSHTGVNVTYDTNYTLPVPSKRGYVFDGWYSGNKHYTGGTWKELSNVTLRAKWIPIVYHITYELDGGTNAPENPATYTILDAVTFKAPERTGYTFIGWTYAGQNTPKLDAVLRKDSINDRTYTAHWRANTYQVTLHAEGGTVDPETLTVTFDQQYTLPTPTRIGYTFIGWYCGNARVESGIWTTATDVTLTARWQANQYTVTFEDTTHGYADVTYVYQDGETPDQVVTLRQGQVLQMPAAPQRAGYVFGGWYTDQALTTLYGFNGALTGDITLYANWITPLENHCNGEISVGQTKSFYTSGTTYRYFAFVPQVDGQITVTISAGSKVRGYLYDKDIATLTSNTAGRTNLTLNYYVTAGEIYYIGFKFYSSASSGDINVALSGPAGSGAVVSLPGGDYSYLVGQTKDMTVTYDRSYTLPILVRRGYTFNGWFNGDNPIANEGSWTTDSGMRLTPRWTPMTHTITLDATGGTVDMTSVNATYDATYVLPIPSRVGYTFAGWFDSEGKQYTSGAVWNNIEDTTLYARWDIITYGITYELNGGENSAYNRDSYTVEDSFDVYAPTRTGYTFLGWTYEGQDTPNPDVYITATTGGMTFTAHWQANTYTVTLDALGGTFEDADQNWVESEDRTATYDQSFILPTPTRTGYTFAGWFDSNNREYTDGVWNDTADTTLYAHWDIITYGITYELNGGENSTYNRDSYTVEDSFDVYAPTRTGYTFLGWTYEGQDTPSLDVYITATTGDITFTAHWQANSYTVSLNANGGEVVQDAVDVVYDSAYALPVPTREGYTFQGWYSNGVLYEDGVWSVDQNVNLTAEWEVIYYALTYELNGGFLEAQNPTEYTIHDSIVLNVPTRTGYSFLGWTYEGQDEPEMSVVIQAGRMGEITFTAHWEANVYGVWFDPNGGQVDTTEETYTYDQVYTLPTPVREGYTFDGWWYNDTEYVSGAWIGTENMTLTARWIANRYHVTLEDVGENDLDQTVTFDFNGADIEPVQKVLYHGDVLAAPAVPLREGYLFAGWYTDADCTELYSFSGEITEDMTLYAKWITNAFGSLNDSALGMVSIGSGVPVELQGQTQLIFAFYAESTQNVIFESASGYDTRGFLYDQNMNQLASDDDHGDGNNFLITYSVTEGTLYYVAIRAYSENTYGSAELIVRDASNQDRASAVVENQIQYYYDPDQDTVVEVEFGSYFELPTLERVGYTFLGWMYNGELYTDYNNYWSIAQDTVLTPVWQANTYNVSLDANGGTFVDEEQNEVSSSDMTATYDQVLTLPTPTRAGYIFEGWFDEYNVAYTSGTWDLLSGVSLSARWIARDDVTYVVNHHWQNANDDEFTLESQETVGTADATVTPEVGEREGFISPEAQTVTILPDGTLVVDYYYYREQSIMTVYPGNGEQPQEITLKYGQTIAPQTPIREGYTFDGWYNDADLTDAFEREIATLESFAIYACWAEDTKPAEFDYDATGDFVIINTYTGDETEVVIPASIAGKLVTTIAPEAFKDMTSLTSIVIPETVTSIGEGAFAGCTGLVELTLPVTESTGQSYTVQNDASNPWTVNEYGELISTNHNHSSSSTYTVTVTHAGTLTFRYMVSSENNCDYLNIYKNGSRIAHISGTTSYQLYTAEVGEGDIITFTYSKDGSVSVGTDCAYIKDLSIRTGLFGGLFGQTEGDGLTAIEQNGTVYYVPASLTKITLTATHIPAGAFENFETLQEVYTPNVQVIGDNAFKNCYMLHKFNSDTENVIRIPDGAQVIGAGAFENVIDAEEIIVADTVTEIGLGAFKGCFMVESLTVPFIGQTATANNATNAVLGHLFGHNGSTQVEGAIAQYYNGNTSSYYYYFIPITLTQVTVTNQETLPTGAFSNCDYITNVTLSDVTTTISNYAFYDCAVLETVDLGNSITSIGAYAFDGCTALNKVNSTVDGTVVIPDSATSIGIYAFRNCAAFDTLVLGQSLSTIHDYAFYGATGLTTVDVHEQSSLSIIGQCAFAGCTSLTRFDVIGNGPADEDQNEDIEETFTETETTIEGTEPEETTEEDSGEEEITEQESVEESAEEETAEQESAEEESAEEETTDEPVPEEPAIEVPDNFVLNLPEGLTSIGANAFQNVSQVTTVIVPDTVTSIGSGAFGGCTSITDIALPFVGRDLNSYNASYYVFGYIFGSVGDNQIYQNYAYFGIPESIRNVTITVQTEIPAFSFYGCDFIQSITIPEETTSIGEYAFHNCSSLEMLNSTTAGEFNIPVDVTIIKSYTFYGCEQMTHFTSGDITSINSNAFANCSALESLYLPESVTLIEQYAFSGCESLSKINSENENTAVIPNTVTSIGRGAFKDCAAISDWTLPFVGNSKNASYPFGYIFDYVSTNQAGTIYQGYYYYYIPDTITKVTITDQVTLPAYAFQNCTMIEEIVLPDTMTTISTSAFYGCTGLKRLNSTRDGEFNVPEQVTTIGDYAFAGCTAMTMLTGGENLVTINQRAFDGCTALTDVTFGSSLTAIGSYAFANCTSLSKINSDQENTFAFPSGLLTIGDYAFMNNQAVTELIVPITVTNVGKGAFKGCESLTDVTLPFVGQSPIASSAPGCLFGYIFDYYNTYGTVANATQQYGTYWYYIPTTITTVNITSQTALPANAFRNCDFIEVINLLEQATVHGTNAFEGCNATVNNTLSLQVAPAWNGEDVAEGFQSGTGTEDDPYVIFTGAQLAYLASQVNSGVSYEGVYFVLGGDILLGDHEITVIGAASTTPFKGHLNGNGHDIRDFTLTSTGAAVGLFGYVEGTIENLGIADAVITVNKNPTNSSNTYVGVLAAYSTGTITNCRITSSSINASCNYTAVAGGLVGYNGGTVSDCYVDVDVDARSTYRYAYAGGIVAQNAEGATVSGCVACGNVTSHSQNERIFTHVGGVVADDAGTVTECYRADTQVITKNQTVGQGTNDIGTVATLLEIRDYCKESWDDSIWNLDPNVPILR